MSTIPASTIVSVVPSVLAAGGTGLTGTGLLLSHNSRIPAGTVQSFSSPQAISTYFGASDPLVNESTFYFDGFQGATLMPSALLLAQFNQTAISAYLRGGNASGLTLAQIQAINATLAVTVDGFNRSATVNLSAATSPSNAASIIQTALNGASLTEGSFTATIAAGTSTITGSIAGNVLTVTAASAVIPNGAALTGAGVTASTVITGQLSGTPGGIGTYAVNNSQIVASESLTATYGLFNVTGVTSGSVAVGQTLSGAGVTAGTLVTQLGTGTGGIGNYYVNFTQTVGSEAITASATTVVVTYDSVSNSFVITSGIVGVASLVAFATGTAATSLLLTSATGAVLSQGAAALTPSAFMNALVVTNSSWANFMTHFDPDGGSGNALKQQFAAWKNTQNSRYGYFAWDPDTSPQTNNPAPASLGQILKANNDSGTLLVWEGGGAATTADTGLCAFALGLAASINYNQVNGRTDFAFRQGLNLVANVVDPTSAANLLTNGYSFYGAYGSANLAFIWFQNGQITGPFLWADSYQTQIWLNLAFQQQFLTMLQNALSVPFNTAGIGLIQQTAQTVIQAGLAFGAFAPNTLTSAQFAQVNAQAGANVAGSLQTQGYYLQILLPSQTVQAARGPWNITFWYIDLQSVQSINLSSVMVQ